MADGELADSRVDELFALEPEAFTAARDELARNLRSEGERAAAAAVKKLRRPTVAAWALNQLVRGHRDEVEDLLGTGEQLRQAQRKTMSGLGAGPLRDAQRSRRVAVDRLTDRAVEILAEHGPVPDDRRQAIRRALEPVSVDEQAAEALLEGRLAHPPEAEAGFGMMEGLTLVPDEPVEPAQADAVETAPERPRREVEQAEARLAAADQAAEEAAAEADRARRAAEEAAGAASEAEAEAERLSTELEAARAEARRHAEQSEQAAARAREAEDGAERRSRERAAAAEELARLRTR